MDHINVNVDGSKKEKEFWQRAYSLGMKNGWCSGRYAMEDGNFIVEDDRLNKNSCIVINKDGKLYKFFKRGNWCLGQAVIHKDLCFIQQVDGGDEWLTIKNFDDEAVAFESISFDMIHYKEFADIVINLLNATKEQCINLEWDTRLRSTTPPLQKGSSWVKEIKKA